VLNSQRARTARARVELTSCARVLTPVHDGHTGNDRHKLARKPAGVRASNAMSRAHEFALARMLAAYETPRAATATRVTHDARKVTQHVHAMRAMLDSLGASCDDAARALYAERIARVEKVAMASADTTAATTSTTSGGGGGNESDDADGSALLRQRRAFATNAASAANRTSTGVSTATTMITHRPASSGRVVQRSARDEEELEKQRLIQEGLTDEMASLASGLKANALAMEKGLERSTKVLEDVETKLERNVQGVKSTVKRQTAAYGVNRRGSCWTWIILFVVGILFAWTYVVIKMSSDKIKKSRM